jgi:hypothetical protein
VVLAVLNEQRRELGFVSMLPRRLVAPHELLYVHDGPLKFGA